MPTAVRNAARLPYAPSSYGPALALVTTLFFMWGFLTALNDILVPHFKVIFDLNYTQAMLIQFTFFVAYVVMAVPSGRVVNWLGYRRSMALGLTAMGIGALLFQPAAAFVSWPLLLVALFVLGSGMTLLQVSCNPYVAILGPEKTASSRLNLSQAFNSVGTAVAPWLGGMLILSSSAISVETLRTLPPAQQAAHRLVEASTVRMPYFAFALILFTLALVVFRFRLPSVSTIEHSGAEVMERGRIVHSAWQVRHLTLGILGIFFYCGAEVSIGSFLVNYLAQPDIAGFSARRAATYVSYYWMGAMIGRFAGAAFLRRIPAGRLLGVFAITASTLVWISIVSKGPVAMWSLIAVGLFNSIMFPTIFSLAIDGLGKLTSQGAGMLFVATLGSAMTPLLQGVLADRIGVHHAFIIPALCYLYVVYYGFWGAKRGTVMPESLPDLQSSQA